MDRLTLEFLADLRSDGTQALARGWIVEDGSETIAFDLEVITALEVHPGALGCAEVPCQAQRSVGADTPLAVHDLVGPARRHMNRNGKPVLGDAQRYEVLLGEDLARMDGGQRRRTIWGEVEHLHQKWQAWGRPRRERYGLTINGESQAIWLDKPLDAPTWHLPS